MTRKELEQYEHFDGLFYNDCQRVANILRDLVEFKGSTNSDITYADNFIIQDDEVQWNGEETWGYIGREYHSGSFPKMYLTLSDKELMDIVNKQNEEYNEKQQLIKEQKEAIQKAERKRQYEELKKEFDE